MNRRFLASILIALALSSCSSKGSTTKNVGDFRSLMNLSSEIWSEEQKLTAACVQASGFEYSIEPFALQDPIDPYVTFPFSNLEADERKTSGYGIVIQQKRSVTMSTENPNLRYAKTLDKPQYNQYMALLFGRVQSSRRSLGLEIRRSTDSRFFGGRSAGPN